MESDTVSQPTRFFITCMASCLLLSVGGRAALAQTSNDDTVRLSRLARVEYENDSQWLDQQQQWLGQQQQQWFKQLEQDKLLGKVPATGVSCRLKNGPGTGGEALGNLDCKVGVLWDAMPIWQPYVEGSFRGGGITERGELDVFMPLLWSDNALLFADLRGSIGDTGHHEGNWSVAARTLTSSCWILGAWAGYDLRESSTGNHFDQVSFGIEAMNLEWDFRMNGYVPTNTDPQRVPGAPASAVFTGNNIFVRSNRESAYWGLDGEIGRLLWANDPCCNRRSNNCGTWVSSLDAELRAFAGGYYFNNPTAGFEKISGPRARTELRLYDLALLGDGSRLTLEGLIQHDNLRGTQTEVGLYVRVPFGPSPGCRMSRMQRRMVDRIVRDVDVVASNQAIDDPANFASTGVAIDSVRVVDANDDLSAEVAAAGEGSVVVVDGSEGPISEGDTTVLSSGQVVMGGGGSTLKMVGRNTDAQIKSPTPGTQPQVDGTDVFQIANDSTLTGLDITGGNDGVFGDSVTGFTLRDLKISKAAQNGVFLEGTNSGDIRNVVSNLNGYNGFYVQTFNDGTFSDNTATENGNDGFYVPTFNDGTFSDNTATKNGDDGFQVNDFNGGTMSGNSANSNGDDGFQIGGPEQSDGDGFSPNNTATFGSNVSSDNTAQGYNIEGTPQTGKDTNTGSGNGGGVNNF